MDVGAGVTFGTRPRMDKLLILLELSISFKGERPLRNNKEAEKYSNPQRDAGTRVKMGVKSA